jgi:small subunit ribosomal protein S2
MSYDIDIKQLLQSGAHFGHKTSRWNPKMAPYIYAKNNGSHIIDLTKTVENLESALIFLENITSTNQQVLIVGTKKQAQPIVQKLADKTKMPYINERWLGGMLTNFSTISKQILHLKNLESQIESGELTQQYSKLEIQRFNEEVENLNKIYGGIKQLNTHPGALFILDVVHDRNAVLEANKLGIKIVGICDSNADPSLIDYPIPANDDSIKTLETISNYVEKAILNGQNKKNKGGEKK